jgi:hypothetical protein
MGSISRFINDGSMTPPRLRIYLNLDNLADLLRYSLWAGHDDLECYQRLIGDGFEGVQLTTDAPAAADAPLPHCGPDRINTHGEANSIAAKHASLPGTHDYARLFLDASGQMVEESDRCEQALLYKDLAHACFAEALSLSSAVQS